MSQHKKIEWKSAEATNIIIASAGIILILISLVWGMEKKSL